MLQWTHERERACHNMKGSSMDLQQAALISALQDTAAALRDATLTATAAGYSAAPPSDNGEPITSPRLAVGYCADMAILTQEHFRVLVLNTRHQVVEAQTIYQGTANQIQLRAAEVFRSAVLANAVGVILVHNHPSGDPAPSADDVASTNKLIAAGKLLDIDVIDHIIIASNGSVSLKERGLGQWK